jgi:hypothetical protein
VGAENTENMAIFPAAWLVLELDLSRTKKIGFDWLGLAVPYSGAAKVVCTSVLVNRCV